MSERTVEGIRYTMENGYYRDAQAQADVLFLLNKVEELEAELKKTVQRIILVAHVAEATLRIG